MSAVAASAPGKAVLLGEYAVLDGAPALVMAVDRRARVQVSPCASRDSRVEVPQLGLAPVGFRLADRGEIAWQGSEASQPSFQRARALLEWLLASERSRPPGRSGLRICIDTGDLYQVTSTGPTKLGLGSSAAMTVALAGALAVYSAPVSMAEQLDWLTRELLSPYRAGQGGRGSGIDLAASLHGGVLRFQLGPQGVSAVPIDLPKALKLAFVWTGEAASTPAFLDRYAHWTASAPVEAERMRQSLGECCQAAMETLRTDDASGLMTCINNYRQLMGKIGDLAGLPVVSEALNEIARVASAFGLACKPCGAGGGDLAMLAGIDEQALELACDSLASRGWSRLRLDAAQQGLRVEQGRA
ncbi:MAG: hypothetical protein V2J42_15170 [Wenzhouxiangella sp.]|jgi:phosphomevalonate kinase|nr:hypothetical protein [Wenzhouxiangella sp.]